MLYVRFGYRIWEGGVMRGNGKGRAQNNNKIFYVSVTDRRLITVWRRYYIIRRFSDY